MPRAIARSIRYKFVLAALAPALAALVVAGIALVAYDLGAYLEADHEWPGRLAGYAGIFGAVAALSLVVSLLIAGWLQRVLAGPILATAEVAREMEEQRHADEELRRLNVELERRVGERTSQLEAANRELESFSYSVSHDLRAPLRAVIGFSKLLVEDHGGQLDDEARRKLTVIQDEARRMGMLIDDLLAFSRLGRKAMQLADIDMTGLARIHFEQLLNGHNDGPKAEFRLATLPRAKGDRTLLGQVWQNLLANALKFSSKRERPLIEVSAVSDEKENIFFVRDNGAGFDPRYQSKLFGVFQRLHASSDFPGTGVGLALVERIVTRHGGRVWADGKPDEGATFYFTLPKEQVHGNV